MSLYSLIKIVYIFSQIRELLRLNVKMLTFTYPLYDFGFMHLSKASKRKKKKKRTTYNLENGKAEKSKRKDLLS